MSLKLSDRQGKCLYRKHHTFYIDFICYFDSLLEHIVVDKTEYSYLVGQGKNRLKPLI